MASAGPPAAHSKLSGMFPVQSVRDVAGLDPEGDVAGDASRGAVENRGEAAQDGGMRVALAALFRPAAIWRTPLRSDFLKLRLRARGLSATLSFQR